MLVPVFGMYTCPEGTNTLPTLFLGTMSNSQSTIMTTPTTIYVTENGDAIGSYYCILRSFLNPNINTQVFMTIGSASNAAADQDVTCAFLDVSKAPKTVIFNVSDPSGGACPINSGYSYTGWQPTGGSSPTLPACPTSSVPLPSSLQGEGKLTDPEGSKNSHLLLASTAWSTLSQGSIVTVLCAASISPISTKGASVTQITFSNTAGAKDDAGGAGGCVWALPVPPNHLSYKFGINGACPVDFSHPTTIPFNFSGAAVEPIVGMTTPFIQPRFLISFWVDPIVPPTQFPFEYARIARANFTAVMGGFGATDPVSVAAQVEACGGAGLQCIPSSCESSTAPGGPASCIGTGRGNPALLGYQLADEPQAKDFPTIAAWLASVASRTDPGTLRFVNLLPNYADFPSAYEDYLQAFVDTVHPDILCFDHYPLFYPGSEVEPSTNVSQAGYLRNLASVRAVGLQSSIPFWNFMNAMPFNGRPDVTEAQVRWQVFSSLAYGAKGVLYFCYWSPTGQSNGFQWGNAILTPRALPGQPPQYAEGPHFAQVSRVNTKLLLLGQLLLKAVSTDVVLLQGNGTLVPTKGAGGNITAVANSIPALPFSALLGVFSGAWSAQGGHVSLSQAILVHNQGVNFPLLLQLQLAPGAVAYESDETGALGMLWNDAPSAPGDTTLSLEAGDARLLFF